MISRASLAAAGCLLLAATIVAAAEADKPYYEAAAYDGGAYRGEYARGDYEAANVCTKSVLQQNTCMYTPSTATAANRDCLVALITATPCSDVGACNDPDLIYVRVPLDCCDASAEANARVHTNHHQAPLPPYYQPWYPETPGQAYCEVTFRYADQIGFAPPTHYTPGILFGIDGSGTCYFGNTTCGGPSCSASSTTGSMTVELKDVQGFARVPALSISPSTGPGTGCGLQLPRVGRDGKTSDSSRRTLADLLKPSANEAAQLTGLLSKAGISVPTPANLDSAEPSSYKHAGHGHKRMVNPHGHAHHHGSGFVDPLFNLTETWYGAATIARARIVRISGNDPCQTYEDFGEFQYTLDFQVLDGPYNATRTQDVINTYPGIAIVSPGQANFKYNRVVEKRSPPAAKHHHEHDA